MGETMIERLRRLGEAATERPWEYSDDCLGHGLLGYWLAEDEERDAEWVNIAEFDDHATAQLAQAAVNALPLFLELARAVEGFIQRNNSDPGDEAFREEMDDLYSSVIAPLYAAYEKLEAADGAS